MPYRLPRYKVALVREGSCVAESNVIRSPEDVFILMKKLKIKRKESEHAPKATGEANKVHEMKAIYPVVRAKVRLIA